MNFTDITRNIIPINIPIEHNIIPIYVNLSLDILLIKLKKYKKYKKNKMDQFTFFWMNKNLNLSNYLPEELEESFKKYSQYLSDNLRDTDIQKCLKEYQQKTKQLNHIQDTFWLKDNQFDNQIMHFSTEYRNTRRLLKKHNKILIFAGAGMSADSGLPIFKSNTKTIFKPNFSNLTEIRDLFNKHQPHEGYTQLLNYCKSREYFVMTTNIDGYFLRSGFDKNKIVEVHGNVYNNQCSIPCNDKIYDKTVIICPKCGEKTRVNVLQFGDKSWINNTKNIDKKMCEWIDENEDILIIEIGAGIHIPTIRDYSEFLVSEKGINSSISLIRVNPEHWQVPKNFLKLSKVSRISQDALKFLNLFI